MVGGLGGVVVLRRQKILEDPVFSLFKGTAWCHFSTDRSYGTVCPCIKRRSPTYFLRISWLFSCERNSFPLRFSSLLRKSSFQLRKDRVPLSSTHLCKIWSHEWLAEWVRLSSHSYQLVHVVTGTETTFASILVRSTERNSTNSPSKQIARQNRIHH